MGYTVDQFGGSRMSYRGGRTASLPPSRRRRTAGVGTWLTGSRGYLPRIDVRMLLVHGDADRVLPLPGHRQAPGGSAAFNFAARDLNAESRFRGEELLSRPDRG